jgi:hypothetical protein
VQETFQWLLVPVQLDPQTGTPDPKGEVRWQAIRLQGNDPLAVRASRKLKNEELLITTLAGTRLRMELDQVPLWRGDHVAIKQLVEDFARYVYLPRLKVPAVLVDAVRDGLRLLTWEQDAFAYADSFDETSGRYRGLRAAQDVALREPDPPGLLVKPEVARRQLEAERQLERPSAPEAATVGTEKAPAPTDSSPPRTLPRRFHGSVELDSTRVGRDASRIAEEIIAHIAALPGAQVRVTLEVEATVPGGVPENVVRTVTENSRTLKFTSHGFEGE